MSNSHLLEWFAQLLFGTSSPSSPPLELRKIILRMESEKIPWLHLIHNGGLTAFPYQIHGDLNSLTDYLEKQWVEKQPYFDPPTFKTRAVSKFWDELQLLLTKRFEIEEPLPLPSKRDDEILKEFLEPTKQIQTDRFNFESAEFWGNVARRFININRPGEASPLPDASSDLFKKVLQLYDVTCKARGQYFDPFNMYLVPQSEYVNAVHWQTSLNLEAFLHDRPTHPLSISVKTLLKKNLNNLLRGEKPILESSEFDALLHNIRVVHEAIPQIPHKDAPPKLIDVFQRLLALCQRDQLWENEVPKIKPEPVSPSLLHLTERVRILEREKRILLKHFNESDSRFDQEPLRRTYSDYLYVKDKKIRS